MNQLYYYGRTRVTCVTASSPASKRRYRIVIYSGCNARLRARACRFFRRGTVTWERRQHLMHGHAPERSADRYVPVRAARSPIPPMDSFISA